MSPNTTHRHSHARARLDALIAEAELALEQARMQQDWFLLERPGWQQHRIETARQLLERARETALVDPTSLLRATMFAHDARDQLVQVLMEFARTLGNLMHHAHETEDAA